LRPALDLLMRATCAALRRRTGPTRDSYLAGRDYVLSRRVRWGEL